MKNIKRASLGCVIGLLVSAAAWAQEEEPPTASEATEEGVPQAEAEPGASPTIENPTTAGEAAETGGDEGTPAEPAPTETNETAEQPAAASGTETTGSETRVDAEDVQTADQEYDIRIRGLESKVNELKERIFRSKAKLELLTEAVTEGGLGQGAVAVIVHRNEMGGNLLLQEVNYFLDGAPIWQETDETGKSLDSKRNHVVFDGNLVEGSHTLTVQMRYQGDGAIFSYLDGYSFNLRASHTFSTEPGKIITVESIGYEQGNFTTEFKDRPQLKFRSDIKANEGIPGE